MNDKSLKLLIPVFDDEQGAEKAMEVIKAKYKDKHSGIQAAVGIIKDENSAIQHKDIGMTPAKGAIGGVILGGAIGVLTGGVGLALGAIGALVGGVIGERKREGQFSEVRMNEVAAALAPGTSAIVAIVEQEHLPELESEFSGFNAEIFTADVTEDLTEKLEDHRHVAYADWIEHLDN